MMVSIKCELISAIFSCVFLAILRNFLLINTMGQPIKGNIKNTINVPLVLIVKEITIKTKIKNGCLNKSVTA